MYKQCFIQLAENGAFGTIWLLVKEAVKGITVDVDYKMYNIKGKAVVVEVFNNITIKG